MDDVDERRLDQLRLEQRRRHFQHRLVREEQRPLAHRANLTGEAQAPETVEEGGAEERSALQIGELVVVEAEVGEECQGVLDPGGDEIAPAGGQVAAEELEGRRLPVDALGEVALAHGQLVEVDQEGRHGAGES